MEEGHFKTAQTSGINKFEFRLSPLVTLDRLLIVLSYWISGKSNLNRVEIFCGDNLHTCGDLSLQYFAPSP